VNCETLTIPTAITGGPAGAFTLERGKAGMPTAEKFKPIPAPFPYFGGKRRAVDLVWPRFGDVQNYVEPFFGSGAMLLGRPPGWRGVETVNDKDCYLANFWRALKYDPDGVCEHCDWPVNEADLHARHRWLLDQAGFRDRMKTEPKFYDVQIAGWWVWGACQWIAGGWCPERCYNGRQTWQQRPHLGDAGRGVHRPSQQLPHLGDAGRGDLLPYLQALSERLRRVRVCCGDWTRVCGGKSGNALRAMLGCGGDQSLAAVFLDPPYSGKVRDTDIYANDDLDIAESVRAWAIAHGDDPRLRICLCGYDGEHAMPGDWTCIASKAGHGYGSQRKGGYKNAGRERLWFSPHCLKVNP